MNYIELLNTVFQTKSDKNKSFSLRSFAKFLDMDPGLLSKYLNGKREIPHNFIISKSSKLELSEAQLEIIQAKANSKDVIKSFRLKNPKEEYTRVDMIHKEVIQNWQYYAILELLKVKDFAPSIEWISNQLHLKEAYTQKLVDDLIEAKLLEITSKGDWIDLTHGSSTHALSDEDINMANKESQRQILELAKRAINEVEPTLREQSSMMMATNKRKITQAKVLIRDFRRKLCDFLEDLNEDEDCDSIYQLSLSLFPLSGNKQENKDN